MYYATMYNSSIIHNKLYVRFFLRIFEFKLVFGREVDTENILLLILLFRKSSGRSKFKFTRYIGCLKTNLLKF